MTTQIVDPVRLFYSTPFYMSYSGLNKLMYSPAVFYKHYVLQQREEKPESYLIDGKVIHCLLLDDGSFDDQFMLIPSTLPGDTGKKVINKVFAIYSQELLQGIERNGNLEIYSQEILSVLKEIKLHQSLKTDQQRIDKITTPENKSYWEFLKIKGDKILLDSETLNRCRDSVEILRSNTSVADQLGLLINEIDNVTIYNEKDLIMETSYSFGLRGVVDNIKVDHDQKLILINDLKTTSKSLSEFKDTIEVYNYWAQAAIYERLVEYHFKEMLTEEWKVEFNFIVIDKYQQVYSFMVSSETMSGWQDRLDKCLQEAEWHYKNKNYSLPYQFASGRVVL